MKKIRNYRFKAVGIILALLLIVSCRMSKEDLCVKCQNNILDSHFFISLNQYLEEDLESGEFRFQYHRLNAKAIFTSDTNEENIDFKKNKINDLLKKIFR